MEKDILLSVVIPSYNNGVRLSEDINSYIKHFPNSNIEFILSDDSEKKESINSLRKLGVEFPLNVQYTKNTVRLGFARNLIKAIKSSSGIYLLLLLDQDSLVVEKIELLLNLIKNNDFQILKCSYFDNATLIKIF